MFMMVWHSVKKRNTYHHHHKAVVRCREKGRNRVEIAFGHYYLHYVDKTKETDPPSPSEWRVQCRWDMPPYCMSIWGWGGTPHVCDVRTAHWCSSRCELASGGNTRPWTMEGIVLSSAGWAATRCEAHHAPRHGGSGCPETRGTFSTSHPSFSGLQKFAIYNTKEKTREQCYQCIINQTVDPKWSWWWG